MSQQQERQEEVEKKSVAGVTFTSTRTGKLDESAIPNDDYKNHYLFDADTKTDSSYPVVDASGALCRGNVESAYQLGARGGVSEDTLHSKLRKLNDEFDNPPIDFGKTTRGNEQQFERSVEFEKGNTKEQIVSGAILIPDELDTQLDYFRADTIRALAENYEERFENSDVYGGVMHSVFPESGIELFESRVLDEPKTLGDDQYPQGTWIQRYKVTDDDLWALIDDGVLGGYSIGGTAKGHVTEPIPDDVRVPEAVANGVPDDVDPSDLPGREITEGRILESSFVDLPAVPRATHVEHKADGLHKGHPALTDSIVQARLYLEGRGHPPDDAKRLAEYLQSEKTASESGIAARIKSLLGRTSGGSGGESALQQPRASTETTKADHFEKGATLSEENVRRGMAIHDIALDLLETEIDTGRQSFATDDSFEFGGVAYVPAAETGDSGDGAGSLFSASKARASTDDDTGGIPSDADSGPQATMSDDDKNEVLERLNELETKFEDDDGEQTDKDADTDTDADDEPSAVERMDELESKFEQQAETQARTLELLEQMADARGVSQQKDVDGRGSEKSMWAGSPFDGRTNQ